MLLNELLVDILKNLEIRFLNLVFINKSLLLSHGSFFLKNDILDKDKSVGKIFQLWAYILTSIVHVCYLLLTY